LAIVGLEFLSDLQKCISFQLTSGPHFLDCLTSGFSSFLYQYEQHCWYFGAKDKASAEVDSPHPAVCKKVLHHLFQLLYKANGVNMSAEMIKH